METNYTVFCYDNCYKNVNYCKDFLFITNIGHISESLFLLMIVTIFFFVSVTIFVTDNDWCP